MVLWDAEKACLDSGRNRIMGLRSMHPFASVVRAVAVHDAAHIRNTYICNAQKRVGGCPPCTGPAAWCDEAATAGKESEK